MYGGIKKHLSESVTSEQDSGMKHVITWGKGIPGTWNSKYLGPEIGMCLACSMSIKESSAIGSK